LGPPKIAAGAKMTMTLCESQYEIAQMIRAVSWHGSSGSRSMQYLACKSVGGKRSKTY
jgi:hypothetical protein